MTTATQHPFLDLVWLHPRTVLSLEEKVKRTTSTCAGRLSVSVEVGVHVYSLYSIARHACRQPCECAITGYVGLRGMAVLVRAKCMIWVGHSKL